MSYTLPVVIRPQYMELVNNDHCAAAILNAFEMWSGKELRFIKKTVQEMQDDLMGLFGLNRVGDAFKRLRGLGFLKAQHNPNNPEDRAWQYQYQAGAVISAVTYVALQKCAVWLRPLALRLMTHSLLAKYHSLQLKNEESESLIPESISESISESRISSIRERDFDPSGKDDKNVSDGGPIDGAVPGRLVRLLPTPDQRKELAAQSQRLGVLLYAEVLERCKEARSWNYVVKALKAENPTPPTPSPRASVVSSAYADWIDVGYGPGVFTAPEQDITQGDTAVDSTPALDDEQREHFRQVDQDDATEPDGFEYVDMSDVIPAGIKALST